MELSSHANIGRKRKHMWLSEKKPIWKATYTYLISMIRHSRKGKRWWLPAVRQRVGINKEASGIPRAVKLLCMRMVGMCHSTSVKTPRITTPRVSSTVNDKLWAIMTYPCRLILGTHVPVWWVTLVTGEFCLCGGRTYRGNLCTFLSILVNLELLWKMRS